MNNLPRNTRYASRDMRYAIRNTRYAILANRPPPSTSVENSLQINLFMQNKPNFQKSQMNVNSYNTKAYANLSDWTIGQSKPNSKPIKPNLRKAKMNVNSLITKDYRKYGDFVVRKNKPNSNPISVKPKMSANVYVIEDYENETTFRPKKTNPNKANFFKGQNELRAYPKIRPHPALDIFESFLDASRPNC